MRILQTSIVIDAPAQTVWSVLDKLDEYPLWNRVLPRISGRTTVGKMLSADIAFTGMDINPFTPTIIRVVGAREFRWMTEVSGDQGYRAEHYFILTPLDADQTYLEHSESLDGPLTEALWPMMDAVGRADYEQLNKDLKARAEELASESLTLHRAITEIANDGEEHLLRQLQCHCSDNPVLVQITGEIRHNHLCGCSKCWKPDGALFAQTGIVAADQISVLSNAEKLAVIDRSQKILRHACTECGVHMFGHVEDEDHHFYGMDFIHPELDGHTPAPRIEWAGFVSSVIEHGLSPTRMAAVRYALRASRIPTYDAFSPELMDVIAWHAVKLGQPSDL